MSGESSSWFWIDRATEPTLGIQVGGAVLVNVHPPEQCAGRPCVMHAPSDHHMREWSTNWRGDTRVMERMCPHGIGHPDPDDVAYQKTIDRAWVGVHGCDGCCSSPISEKASDEA